MPQYRMRHHGMGRCIYRDLRRRHRCRSKSRFLEQGDRSQNPWAHAMQSCDLPYQADTTPTNGQHVQGRRWRRRNYRDALESCTPAKHVRPFLQFSAWSGT
jgi:hypothetical protein